MIKWAMTASKSKDVLEPEMLAFCQAHHIPVLARQNKSIAYLYHNHKSKTCGNNALYWRNKCLLYSIHQHQ